MVKKYKYRLQIVLDEKKRNKEEAVRRVNEARNKLEEEEKKYNELVKKREKLIEKIKSEKERRINFSSDENFTVDDSVKLKMYIEGLENKKKLLEAEIFNQREKVSEAKGFLKIEEEKLISATKEYEAFKKHKEKWVQKMKREEEKKEQKKIEEIGTLQFLKNFREGKE